MTRTGRPRDDTNAGPIMKRGGGVERLHSRPADSLGRGEGR